MFAKTCDGNCAYTYYFSRTFRLTLCEHLLQRKRLESVKRMKYCVKMMCISYLNPNKFKTATTLLT